MKWPSILKPKEKKPWPVFIGKCILLMGSLMALGWWFSTHFEVGIARGKPCMPGKYYFIELDREPALQHGDIIVFRTDSRTAPFYMPGTRFVKAVRGIPGDHVQIDAAGKVQIDSVTSGPHGDVLTGKDYHFEAALEPQVLKLLDEKHKLPVSLATDYIIPHDSYFCMGTLPDSYDSRYWGLVHQRQVVGKALIVVEHKSIRETLKAVLAGFGMAFPAFAQVID